MPSHEPAHTWSARSAAYADSAPHLHGPSLPKLLALARPQPHDRCLDLGTGTGHTAARLAHAGANVIGVDPSPGMLAEARARYPLPNLRFVEGSGEALPFADASFELVTARHTLHHHRDLAASLREVRRVLAPGGRLVIVDEVTPDESSDEAEAWLDALERARDATHLRAYRLTAWRKFLADAGLSWVVGDADTRYRLEVRSWIERMALEPAAAEAVRALFRTAPEEARRLFAIRYHQDDAISFELPMALILALRPEEDSP